MLLNSCSRGRLDGNCGEVSFKSVGWEPAPNQITVSKKENNRKYLGLIDGDSVSFESATISSRGVILS